MRKRGGGGGRERHIRVRVERIASQQHPLAHVIHCIAAASMFVGKRVQKNVQVVAGGTA